MLEAGEPLLNVGDYTYVNALTNLLTVESLLFASFSLAVSLSGPVSWGTRRWMFGVSGKHVAAAAVGVLALVATGAGFAWYEIFVSNGWPGGLHGSIVVLAIAAAIVAQPVLALFPRYGVARRMKPTIPKPFRSIGSEYSVRPWIAAKDFPLEGYFVCISNIIKTLNDKGVHDPEWATVVTMLAATLDAEEALYAYVEKNKKDVGDAARWFDVCKAAAWVLVEKHCLADEGGEEAE